jgi:hypothetical protein
MNKPQSAAQAALSDNSLRLSFGKQTLDEQLDQLRALQESMGHAPEVSPRLANEAYLLLHSEQFAQLREMIFDLSFRMRPPIQASQEANAAAMVAYTARCGLIEALWAVAKEHERNIKAKQEHNDG